MRRSVLSSTWLWALVGFVLVALVPLVVRNNYWLGVMTFIAINTILAVGLNLLMGYAGQASLGHAAFFGIGAYTSAILTTQHHVSPWLAMPIGIVLTGLVAWLVGVPCLRLRGHYLAMATLGFGWIIFILMVHWDALTGGTSGIESIPKLVLPIPEHTLVAGGNTTTALVLGGAIDCDLERFYLAGALAILMLVCSANLVKSRVGRALRALHFGESAAATLGVDVAKYKVQVFVLSAMYAAFAGSLYAHMVNFISPSTFGFGFSVELVVMVVIGGMASVWGALVGAGTITLLTEWLRSLGEAVPLFKDFDVIAHGLILILVMIFLPSGLFCGARDGIVRLFRRKTPPAAPTPDAAPQREVATP